jgi:hypothetical protein
VLKKWLLTASVVCLFMVIPSVAAAGQLDGETLTGGSPNAFYNPCNDNGDGTTTLTTRGRPPRSLFGVAAGPVIGTFNRGYLGATFDNATGVVTVFGAGVVMVPADGTQVFSVGIELGSGQGVASCAPDGSWTLNVAGATYVNDDTGDTGVASVSATSVSTGEGTFTAVLGPQLPTSKAQCDKNGWKTFPGFKNQGDCVSYVATKGKNKPAGS